MFKIKVLIVLQKLVLRKGQGSVQKDNTSVPNAPPGNGDGCTYKTPINISILQFPFSKVYNRTQGISIYFYNINTIYRHGQLNNNAAYRLQPITCNRT